MDRENAADLLGKLIAVDAYADSYRDIIQTLRDPKSILGSDDHSNAYRAASSLYNRLDAPERQALEYVIHDSIVAGLHRLLVVSDSGGSFPADPALGENQASVSLTLSIHDADDNLISTVQVTPTEDGEELHDIFMNYVDEIKSTLLPG